MVNGQSVKWASAVCAVVWIFAVLWDLSLPSPCP